MSGHTTSGPGARAGAKAPGPEPPTLEPDDEKPEPDGQLTIESFPEYLGEIPVPYNCIPY